MITIITPTIKGREDMLAECVASVKAQTKPVKHTIILDNKKLGAPAIRNKAVEDAKTDWVLFLDDDDLLHPKHIEKIEQFLKDFDVIVTWPEYIGMPVQPQWLYKEFDPSILDEWCPWGQCAAVRCSKYLEAGGQPEKGVVFEDWALWKRMREADAKFKVVPEILWVHRWHPGQRTNDDLQQHRDGKLKLH